MIELLTGLDWKLANDTGLPDKVFTVKSYTERAEHSAMRMRAKLARNNPFESIPFYRAKAG
jgi:hypothetical protein